MANLVKDICNLDNIYDSNYQYSLPKTILESFLSGNAFDHHNLYSDEERIHLHRDIEDLYAKIISSNPSQRSLAIITAGAPGSGKTYLIKQLLKEDKSFTYICPDDVCLRNQTRTYQADIEASDKSFKSLKTAYDKWRPGSNAATHLILANLIREKYDFYFGSTSSSPVTFKFFEFLKNQNYRIKLIHVSAPADIRFASILKRGETFVQVTEEDVKEKGRMVYERLNDTFLKYADEIDFYYRKDVDKDAILAAKWMRSEKEADLATLDVCNPEAYEQVKNLQNETAHILKRPDLLWGNSVEKCSKMVRNITFQSNSTDAEQLS